MLVIYLVVGLVLMMVNVVGVWNDLEMGYAECGIAFVFGAITGSIFVIVAWPITLICVAYRLWRDKVD